ncbi:FkbM family methyltransferase [Alicyclobacillus sacchari]|uniref:FkbM family methyltransferase n=1 Tax=Alicyclobacillus sacchari TaxID=392010 RepID=UPI0024E06405|nr:FkbM family methyltransferase [Alicyclobacillus sacchari]
MTYPLCLVLATHGVFEVQLTKYLIDTVKPGNVVFDIGANIGYFTVLMGLLVQRNGRVVAYEPSPAIFNFLQDNIFINYTNEQTTVVNAAVHDHVGTIALFQTSKFTGNSSVFEPDTQYFSYFRSDEEVTRISIACEPLDKHLHSFEKIDLIKIDVEGAELHVFEGMTDLFHAKKVARVVFEFNKMRIGEQWHRLLDKLLYYRDAFEVTFYTLNNEGQPVICDIVDLLQRNNIVENIVMLFPTP